MSIFLNSPRTAYRFFFVNACIIIGGLLIMAYLYFIDGSNVLILYNLPAPTVEANFDSNGNFIDKKEFKSGEYLSYGVDYCKNRTTPAKLYGSYIDTAKIDMPVVEVIEAKGCGKSIVTLYKIPPMLPTGTYHFEVEIVYQVNPLRKVSVKYKTQDFKIINNVLN